MRVATITWNPNSDTTKIKYTKEFLESDWILKADILKDILGMSMENYDEFMHSELDRRDQ